MASGAVRVRGLKELNRAFRALDKSLSKDLTDELKKAADPVKDEAEHLALSQIRNMPRSPQWAEMRIGVSKAQGLVYMVPVQRGGRRWSRGKFKGILLRESMRPSVENKRGEVIEQIDDWLDRWGGEEGF